MIPRSLLLLKRSTAVPIRGRYSHPLPDRIQLSTGAAMYERKTPLEHILLRPGMYIGQVTFTSLDTWILNQNTLRMEKKTMRYCPALLKIFDEILVNAADNKQRDKSMSNINISVEITEAKDLQISITNNGKGIPITKHKKEKIFVPELIFGHLLTGSNFDDNVSRLTGGSHGYGAKLTNIFSKTFEIETYDAKKRQCYQQTWRDNMTVVTPPSIVKQDASNKSDISSDNSSSKSAGIVAIDKASNLGMLAGNYTKITFVPDLERFGFHSDKDSVEYDTQLEQAIYMFQRRALDVAACIAPTTVNFSGPASTVTKQSRQQKQTNKRKPKPQLLLSSSDLESTNPDIAMDGTLPAVRSFLSYVGLFGNLQLDSADDENGAEEEEEEGAREGRGGTIVYTKVNNRWEVAVGLSPTGSFENMSFVNNVWTSRGGSHVNLVTTQVIKAIETAVQKQGSSNLNTGSSINASIRNRLMVFVNCKVENPAFEGQTKDALNSHPSSFGSNCRLTEAFLKEIVQETGIVESILEDLATKERNRMLNRTKTSSRRQLLVDVPKLEDAHSAGGAEALKCTLILTEGDSAKALAIAGLEVVGRARYGVMPLRGKLLNVRAAPRTQLLNNGEFINLCKALGLDFRKTYSDGLENEGLRYGKVMIMCDQDIDGSHIKGLVINLFHHFWPALLQHEGFLQQFITPIVKVRAKGNVSLTASVFGANGDEDSPTQKKAPKKAPKSNDESRNNKVISFYSLPEFHQWQREQEEASSRSNSGGDIGKGGKYSIKYYKGLGTSTASEGREYFQALAKHRKVFKSVQPEDDNAIDLAFSKTRVADRRDWLSAQQDVGFDDSFVDPASKRISYEEFIHKELVQFSYADIQRSIPSVVDGLKPSQRKVLYGCFKKRLLKEEAKVVQVAGYIAENTAYHHGEASLHSTIINMAQNYVGANNVPLLEASGQFGTRAQGGKDFASPRYIFTRLSPITRVLFPEEDEDLLEYLEEDGQTVEPRYFVPVIPTLLLNGTHGIGTGWSTYIPPYHLPHVVEAVSQRIKRGEPLMTSIESHTSSNSNEVYTSNSDPGIHPYVVGFRGTIEPLLETSSTIQAPTPASSNRSSSGASSSSITNTIRSYRSVGIVKRLSNTQAEITELPYGIWTDDYKKYLYTLVERGVIKEIKEFHSTDRVRFLITSSKSQLDAMENSTGSSSTTRGGKDGDLEGGDQNLASQFRLTSNIHLTNMHAFDAHGRICKYHHPYEILEAHYHIRYDAYERRKAAMERKYAAEELRSRNKSRFISHILQGDLSLMPSAHRLSSPAVGGGRTEWDIVSDLHAQGFATESAIQSILCDQQPSSAVIVGDGNSGVKHNRAGGNRNGDSTGSSNDFAYLLDMPILSLTEERSQSLQQRAAEASAKLSDVSAKTVPDLWLADLDKLSRAYDNLEVQ